MELQQQYLEGLVARHDSKLDLVHNLIRLLGLSKDAVYRRLRGATALTASELLLLQKHYPATTNAGMFQFSFAEKEIKSAGDYIGQLEERLNQIKQLTGLHLLVANPGIPFFHEMIYPRLFAFKLFIYGSTCWNFPGWREMKFRKSIIDNQVLEKARSLGEFSYTVPGKELWTMGILNATLDQLEFMMMAGRFADDREAFLLLDDLEHLISHLEAMSKAGRKFMPGGDPAAGPVFLPAQNELANNDNVILVESHQVSQLFATFITPNFLQTDNKIVCQLTKDWFEVVDEVSTPLGAAAGQQRHWYFNRLRKQLQSVRERIGSAERIKI